MSVKTKRNEIINNVTHNIKKVSPRIRVLDKANEIADLVLAQEDKYAKMSMNELRNLSYRMMDEIESGKSLDNFLIDGLAIAREAIYRVHKMRAYKVQIIGAIIAHFGDFAEMKTGEGKTLTLLLVSYVNALSRKGVHIVTVNEYLVERDMNFSQEALGELGITVGYVTSSMQPDQKKKMYACDITYVSNSELGFDYLRDNMVQDVSEKMQRGLNFAIIDEADSVLIDEARTPLIIAANPDDGVGLYLEVDAFVKTLDPNDYVIDLESHAINLNDLGIKKTEEHFKVKNLYDIENSELVHKLMNALRANYIMEAGKEYVVRMSKKKQKPEIALVDSFTGRIMEGRMYSAGLHQAIQAKEGVEVEPENVTVATITYQSFFRLYKKIAGFSGTALTEKNEFLNIYNMVVVDIPTNKPVIRIDQPDYIFASKQTKWKYVVAEIKRRHEVGQPVLVGTVSVEDSELLHRLLDHIKIPHTVLNAKNNSMEAEIVKKAGQKGAVTIATNMAGRGTDIKLGPGVKELGGLYVLGTERNESRRIDNQLRGRSGRQGDPGESRFFISLQDSLFKRFASDKFDKAQFKLGEEVIDLKFFSKLLDRTQKRVENMNFDIRKNLIDYDYVLSEQRELIYKQRNTILLSDDIFLVVKKMIPRIVDVLISINRDKENVNMVDVNKLVEEINKKLKLNFTDLIPELKNKSDNEIHSILVKEITKKVKEKYDSLPKNEVNSYWKRIIISSLDKNWTKFLDKIQKLRDGVSLRSFEQKSPLNIYVEDSDRLFYNITITIAEEVVSSILNESNTISSGQSTIMHLKTPTQASTKTIDSLDVSSKLDENKPSTNVEPINTSDNDSTNKNEDKLEKQNSRIEQKEEKMDRNENNEEIIIDIEDDEDKVGNNVNDVVNEILGIKTNDSTSNSEVRVSSSNNSVPPPIPNASSPKTPPPIPTAKNDTNNDDFLKQVMNVVDNDIDAEPVDLTIIDEMIREDKEKEKQDAVYVTEEIKPIIPTKPISSNQDQQSPTRIVTYSKEHRVINSNNNVKANISSSGEVVYERPANGAFVREDEIKLENYHHNLRIEKGDIFEMDRIQSEMNKKNIELINQKYQSIIEVKDQNINTLIEKNKSLEERSNDDHLGFSRKIEDLYRQENQELREVRSKFEDLLTQKEKLEKTLYDFQLKELQKQQDEILAQKDQLILERKKLEEERIRKEEEEKREQERLEREKQEQLHLERMRIEREALAKQKEIIENLIQEQKKIQEQELAMQQKKNEEAMAAAAAASRQMNKNNNNNNVNKIVSLSEAKKVGNGTRPRSTMPTRAKQF